MSKNTIVVLVIVTIFLGVYLYSNNSKQIDQQDIIVQTKTKQVDATIKPSDSTISKQYLPYTNEVLANSSLSRRVLFFYASWCSTCRPADVDFSANQSRIPEDVMLIRVNYNDDNTSDDERELASKYNITYQHTFVQIDSEGNVVTKWNGGKTVDLIKNLK